MVSFNNVVPELVSIYVDGVFLANATNYELNLTKSVTKTAVIGTKEQRIAEGTEQISGSLTVLKTSDAFTRMMRQRELGNLDFLSLARTNPAGATDFDQGTALVQRTLSSGNLTYSQDFVATGTKLRQIYITAARSSTFVANLTVKLKLTTTVLATYVIPNDSIPTVKGQVEYYMSLADTIPALTVGTQYNLEFSIPGASTGTLSLYGGDIKDTYLIGTGNGATVNFDLAHTTVVSSSLYIRKGADDGWLGQLEGYTFGDGLGAGGVDRITFSTAPLAGVEIYATYQFNSNTLIAWKLGMSQVTDPVYRIKYEMSDTDGTLLESYVIERVKFTSVGLTVNPAAFNEQTIQFEGEVISTKPYA